MKTSSSKLGGSSRESASRIKGVTELAANHGAANVGQSRQCHNGNQPGKDKGSKEWKSFRSRLMINEKGKGPEITSERSNSYATSDRTNQKGSVKGKGREKIPKSPYWDLFKGPGKNEKHDKSGCKVVDIEAGTKRREKDAGRQNTTPREKAEQKDPSTDGKVVRNKALKLLVRIEDSVRNKNTTGAEKENDSRARQDDDPSNVSPNRLSVWLHWILPICLILLLAIVAAALSIVLFQHLKDDDDDWASGYNQVDSILRLNKIETFMIQNGVSTQESFASSDDSPQSQAAQWLAWMDTAALNIPDANSNADSVYSFVTRYIIAVLYYATDGTNWERQMDFLSERSVCSWQSMVYAETGEEVLVGIICDSKGLVTQINLNGNGLRGELPPELNHLTSLTSLQVSYNGGIGGSIPSGMNNLANLEHVSMSKNDMTGFLPTELCELTNLKTLYLGFNEFEGKIPSCIDSLVHLETLFLSNNFLSGVVPEEISNIKNLQLLWLDDNLLSGDVSTMFNQMPNLRVIFLEDNDFVGVIDENFLRNSKNLVQLDVSDNRLEGTIPGHFFSEAEFQNLEVMDWHGNRLSGDLPEISEPNQVLQFLAIYRNRFTGTLPSTWGEHLLGLFHLDVSRNQLTGVIPSSIGGMTGLLNLFVGGNNWTPGPVPTWLSNLSHLRELSLKNSLRTGPIPMDTLMTLKQLVFLDLDNNQLTGGIPARFYTLTNLEFLLLNRNQLTGSIPVELSQLTKLRVAFFEGNYLTGSLDAICDLDNFADFEIGDSGLLVSDCGSSDTSMVPVQCKCCEICCEAAPQIPPTYTEATASRPSRATCHDWTGPSNLNPRWESVYARESYVFGYQVWFEARADS